jgi:hypothetical protein
MKQSRLRPAIALVFLSLLLGAFPAAARYLPYSPVTPRQGVAAVQRRAARHTVLLEVLPAACIIQCSFWSRLVIHDPQGVEPPRDVTPGGPTGVVLTAAAWEADDGTLRLLAYTGGNFLFSGDGGATWGLVALPAQARFSSGPPVFHATDIGGPVVGGTSSPIRLGTAGVPFVLSIDDPAQPGIWGVRADGSAAYLEPASGAALLGSDIGGTTFLVGAYAFGSPLPTGQPTSWNVATLDLSGKLTALLQVPINYGPPYAPGNPPWLEGWITPGGAVYFNAVWASTPTAPFSSTVSVSFLQNGSLKELTTAASASPLPLFGVPTADFTGAWIVNRDAATTTLMLHTAGGGLVPQWSDPARPSVSALHAGGSGQRVLVQTFRTRPQGDTAVGLAIWSVGAPFPGSYDQLVLQGSEGFAHLDVDVVAQGQPFLFGAVVVYYSPFQLGWLPGATAELGVVRASLAQQLLVPASARAPGMFGAFWKTDLVLRNPDSAPLSLTARFLPNPETSGPAADAIVTLGASSIAVIADVLGSVFHLEKGSGAVLLIPEGSRTVEATSRSYTAVTNGTYGMGVDAIDLSATAGPSVPAMFPAGLLGTGFRTNVVATDATGQGAQLGLVLSTAAGTMGSGLTISVPVNGQSQITGLAGWLGTPASETGSVTLTSDSGRAASGVIAIDNRTNDPTWFAPAAASQTGGYWNPWNVIPAVVHADGANGAQFRTDLFLFNPDATPTTVLLAVKAWDQDVDESVVNVTLAPGESTVIRDVLATAFMGTGVARLRFQSDWIGPLLGPRVTSRTYTVQPDGATYGMQLPALDALQTGTDGDTLEILGPTGGPAFRTNVALVGVGDGYLAPFMSAWGQPVSAHVEILDDHGVLLDSFDVLVPFRGGVQVNDVFRTRNLGDGPKAALIRVRPTGGFLAAYATTIDNGTNDSVYFAANLAAP